MFLQWEKTVSSAMLKQGMGEGQISEILQSREVTEEGEKLLEKLGHMEKENLWLLETGGKNNFLFGIVLAAGSFLAVFWFLGGASVFLLQREKQYENAVKIIDAFQKGETGLRLPGSDTGGIYRLFSSVNRLATAFCAREESAQKAKDFLKDMVSDISHQLKTPLAAVNMYMEIMMEDREAVEVFGEKAILSLERMERLTGNLLKIARLDAKTISFEKTPCNVGGLVRDAAEGFITRAEKEGKQIFLEGEETILSCDRSWTEEAVSNLIKNSLDHTGRGDFVKISWEKSPVMIRILFLCCSCIWISCCDQSDRCFSYHKQHQYERCVQNAAVWGNESHRNVGQTGIAHGSSGSCHLWRLRHCGWSAWRDSRT